MDYGLITNPKILLEQILKEVPYSDMPAEDEPLLHFLVYYIWRGMFHSRRRIILNHNTQVGSSDKTTLLGLSLSIYKSFVPVVHLTRLGYIGDGLALLRNCIERIALLGYLDSNRHQIPNYERNEMLYETANRWARKKWDNDPRIRPFHTVYHFSSMMTHSRLVGVAGHLVMDNNVIGRAFRKDLVPDDYSEHVDYSTLFMGLTLALYLVDRTAKSLFDVKDFVTLPDDLDFLQYFPRTDLDSFVSFWDELRREVKAKKP